MLRPQCVSQSISSANGSWFEGMGDGESKWLMKHLPSPRHTSWRAAPSRGLRGFAQTSYNSRGKAGSYHCT